jgi:hypothetical protein
LQRLQWVDSRLSGSSGVSYLEVAHSREGDTRQERSAGAVADLSGSNTAFAAAHAEACLYRAARPIALLAAVRGAYAYAVRVKLEARVTALVDSLLAVYLRVGIG